MENSIVAAAALLSVCSGGLSEESTVHRTVVLGGQTAVLPCAFIFTGTERLTIEWTKNEESLSPNFVFLFRSGREDYHMKNRLFQHRTHLFMDELSKGDASLRISYVSLSDAGKYKCKTIQDSGQKESEVELFVGSASEPEFLEVSIVSEGVSLRCRAICWFPEPQMTLLNEQGKVINAENSTTERRNGTGCFTITGRSSVLSGGRFICRVHQAELNLTRKTEINILTESRAEYVKSSSSWTSSLAVVGSILLGFLLTVIIFVIFGKKLDECVFDPMRRWCLRRCGGENKQNDDQILEDHNSQNEKFEQAGGPADVEVDQNKTSSNDQSLSRSQTNVSNSTDGASCQTVEENSPRLEASKNTLPNQKTESSRSVSVKRQNSAPAQLFNTGPKRRTSQSSRDHGLETSPLMEDFED